MKIATRRGFLKGATAAVGWGAAQAVLPGCAGRAFATEDRLPIKYSICNETFGDWPQERVFRFAAECGYGGVEIAPFTLATYVTDIPSKRREELRKQAREAGVQIVGLHWLLSKTEGFHLTSPDAAVRRKTAQYLGELARFCADLGGRVMVFGSPPQRNLPPGVSPEEGTRYAIEVLQAAMPVLKQHDVVLALEPLGPKETNFMSTAAETLEVARQVDSPNCRMLLDCKAMATEPMPIPELIHKCRQWMVHFHANDPNLRGPGMGTLDFVPILAALKEVGYGGWISVEVFDYTPGPERLARESIRYLRQVEAKLGGKS
jgi:sugar phosphate isomerase/epimerase